MMEFKAWDKKEKKMIYPSSDAQAGKEYTFQIRLDGSFSVKRKVLLKLQNPPHLNSTCYVAVDSNNFELFFSVGLTTKDNKKLFPGDVIQKEGEKSVTVGYGEYEESSADSWGVKAKHFGPHIIFEDGGKYAITQDGSGYSIASGECDHLGHSYEQ